MEEENNSDLEVYQGMTAGEVMDTYIVGVGVENRMPIVYRKCIIIFLKMILGDKIEVYQEANLYRRLQKPSFQYQFVSVVGALMLTLQYIEAYEMLEKVQQAVDKLANSVHLKGRDFWEVLPFKPRKLETKD